MTLLVLFALIVCTTSLLGLVSLWAATSSRHWFLRTAAVGGVLLLMTPLDAYETIALGAVIALTVVTPVCAIRWWRNRKKQPAEWKLRFSLSTILLLTVVVAVVVAVVVRATKREYGWLPSWTTIISDGISLGFLILAAGWLAVGQARLWLRTLIVGGYVLIQTIWFGFDSEVLPMLCGLLSDDPFAYSGRFWHWLVILPLTASVIVVWILSTKAAGWLKSHCAAQSIPASPRILRIPSKIVCVLLSCFLVLPTLYFYYRLLTPVPIPQVTLPKPNGFHDLVAAGQTIDESRVFGQDGSSPEMIQTELEKYSEAMDRARLGLSRTCRVPIQYELDWISHHDRHGQMWTLANAFKDQGRIAVRESRHEDAVESYLQAVRLGAESRRGGLEIDLIVGLQHEGEGLNGLYECRKQLSEIQLRNVVNQLLTIRSNCEPIADAYSRQRIWNEHAGGWILRLISIVENLCGEPASHTYLDRGIKRNSMRGEMLITVLSLQAYQLKNGQFPEKLELLVPSYLPSAPDDLFSEECLVYKREQNGYLLYSVGENGVDDGGQPEEVSDGLPIHGWEKVKQGDLLVTDLFTELDEEDTDDNSSAKTPSPSSYDSDFLDLFGTPPAAAD